MMVQIKTIFRTNFIPIDIWLPAIFMLFRSGNIQELIDFIKKQQIIFLSFIC
jgi:hypothetical protein